MIDRFLADTGVFVRWYIEQDGFEDALRMRAAHLAGTVALETVDFVRFELGDVLRRKGLLNKKITAEQYVAAVRSVDDVGVQVHVTTADVLEEAAELASRHMVSFTDAVLVAWALELGSRILTTDKRLSNAVAGFARAQLLVGAAP